jgi:hypothetical protein
MQYKRVISFGDSFIYGSELVDDFGTITSETVVCNIDKYPEKYKILYQRATGQDSTKFDERASQLTWPALLAKSINASYLCLASPGASNQTILRQILSQLDNLSPDDFVIIGWTYINRWDFFSDNEWVTIRPDSTNQLSKVYLKYMQSELWDKFETLKSMVLVSSLLRDRGIGNLITCQDTLIFDSEFNTDLYITSLQKEVCNDVVWFNNTGFYDWAVSQNFPCGEENGHPLEEAHQAAFEYIRDNYDFTK